MTRLGVIGWPVAHSRSPAMFAAAFAASGMTDWSYQRLPVAPELFDATVRALDGSGFAGANVTIPHKRAALALADEASEAARAIGAANTLSFGGGADRDADGGGGTIAAENTDAPGLLAAIGEPVAGRTAQVLGAGGSARAVVWALLGAGASEVSVWNRTAERAIELAAELGARAVPKPAAADLLVNCTSVGLQRTASDAEALNQLALRADQVGSYAYVVDLVYGENGTPLLAAAQAAGARTVDGLDMLVAQGALSFELWTGRKAPREAMREGASGQPS
jgi:shikimate dehydrogenase